MRGFLALRRAVLALGLALALPVSLAAPLAAETTEAMPAASARIAALSEIFQIAPMFDVLRQEGMHYGADLDADLLEGQGGLIWLAKVGAVYDTGRMRARYDAAMLAELGMDSAALTGIEAFFSTGLGQRVMVLELEARRTLLDDAAKQAAEREFAGLRGRGGARLAALTEMVEVNDLVESNVMGGLNANLAFYRGLSEAAPPGDRMNEAEILAEVWASEADVRTETENWLYPFLNLAYQPLSDADLQDYIGFSRSPAGQRLNRAMFSAFDQIFTAISADLGRVLGREMQGQAL